MNGKILILSLFLAAACFASCSAQYVVDPDPRCKGLQEKDVCDYPNSVNGVRWVCCANDDGALQCVAVDQNHLQCMAP